MEELTTTSGIVALAAAAAATVALVLLAILAFKLRRLRKKQSLVLGDSGERDLVRHAVEIQQAVEAIRDYTEDVGQKLKSKIDDLELRLRECLSHHSVVRYDAYNEMSGRQSSTLALLDEERSGIVVSSILHRDQARIYVKHLDRGSSEIELSPEEAEAVKAAFERSQAISDLSGDEPSAAYENRIPGA